MCSTSCFKNDCFDEIYVFKKNFYKYAIKFNKKKYQNQSHKPTYSDLKEAVFEKLG